MVLNQLRSLHPSLTFTHEKKVEGKFPFLDVIVEKSNTEFLTSVYRKPTFTGQYIRWDSFGPKSRKKQFNWYACTQSPYHLVTLKLSHKLNSIRSILSSNGYPDRVIDLGLQKKL